MGNWTDKLTTTGENPIVLTSVEDAVSN